MRSKRVTRNSTFRGALSHGASPNQGERDAATVVIESTFHRGGYRLYSNFAFLFSAVVIKCADEGISDYEQISRSTNRSLDPVRRIPWAFARWMRWYLSS
jgi:hypothetical protein